MSTIVGVECTDGTLLAADRLLVQEGRVESTSRERLVVVDDAAGAVCTGPAGGVDEFVRRFAQEVRSYRTERGEMGIDPVASRAASIAADESVDVVVAAHDEDGDAQLRAIGRDGSALDDSPAARGSGAPMLLGALDVDDVDLETAETQVREAFEAVADRDPKTGDEIDVWRLPDE
jgi:proteasome beta subunit